MEDLVQVRQDLFCLCKSEKLLDIVIQESRCVEHGLKYWMFKVATKQAAYIFSRPYQRHLAGVKVSIKQERVDENFLEINVLVYFLQNGLTLFSPPPQEEG